MKRGGVVLDIAASTRKMFGILLSRQHKLVFGTQSPDLLAKVADAAAAGKLLPFIGKTVPLSQAIPALSELEQNGMPKGKLVIVPT